MRAGYDAVGLHAGLSARGQGRRSSFDAAIDVYIEASRGAPSRVALIASLPETISARVRKHCLEGGVVPLQGQREALEALAAAGSRRHRRGAPGPGSSCAYPRSRARSAADVQSLSEAEGKAALADIRRRAFPAAGWWPASQAAASAEALGFPVVIKAVGAHLEHKTEVGGVVLNVRSASRARRTRRAGSSALSDTLLVEEMIADGVAEVLVGLIVDPQFGQVLVLGAGGVLTELLADSVTLLPPFTPLVGRSPHSPRSRSRNCSHGFRGKPARRRRCARSRPFSAWRATPPRTSRRCSEIDVNPVIVRPAGKGAVAVDALIRLKKISSNLKGSPMSDGVKPSKTATFSRSRSIGPRRMPSISRPAAA